MKKLKVMTIIGTRPEIIRLSRVINALDQHMDHCLVHTGQNYDYELNEIFFEDLALRRPDYFLEAVGNSAVETIGKIIINIEEVLDEVNPDAVLILGDTNSCLAALVAKRKKIPIFHMEAGNRCFDMRVPEEINRRIVDHIADINLTYSTIARDYLLAEGLPADRVIKTGSPMFEVIQHYKPRIDASSVLKKLELTENQYYVVSCHREENIDSDRNFTNLVETLNAMAERFKKPILFSAHPRTAKKLKQQGIKFNADIRISKPLCFTDYVKLQTQAKAVLSDSGTITEEASILNFPALNIRESHERPEGFEEASVMMVGLEKERVLQGLDILDAQQADPASTMRPVEDYKMPNVAAKVVRIILSYRDYVNRTVWKQY